MVNKVLLIGYLGRDAELVQTEHGAVVRLAVATTEKWVAKDGSKREQTEWHQVVWWPRSDAVIPYLRKGRLVYVDGSLRYRTWEDAAGQKRNSTDIRAHRIALLGSPSGSRDRADQSLIDRPSVGPSEDEDDEVPF